MFNNVCHALKKYNIWCVDYHTKTYVNDIFMNRNWITPHGIYNTSLIGSSDLALIDVQGEIFLLSGEDMQ